MPSEDCYIRLATEDDREGILNFLRKFYFRDAPLSGYLQISTCKELEESSMRNLEDGLTVLATTKSNEIIGAAVCERLRYNDYGMSNNALYNKMIKLFDLVERPMWVEGKMLNGARKEIYLKDASVDLGWRRRGIFKKLTERLYELARQEGYTKLWATCSSSYSAEGLEKAGYKCVNAIKYEEYREHGEVVFRPPHPHTHLKLMARSI